MSCLDLFRHPFQVRLMPGELFQEDLTGHLCTTNTGVHDVPFLTTNLCLRISGHLYKNVKMFWYEFEKLKCFPKCFKLLDALGRTSTVLLDDPLGFLELLFEDGESFSRQHRVCTFILFRVVVFFLFARHNLCGWYYILYRIEKANKKIS